MNCDFCKQKNIGRDHHCPQDFSGNMEGFTLYGKALSEKELQALYKPRMHPYKFTIWAMAVIGLATIVIVRWLV